MRVFWRNNTAWIDIHIRGKRHRQAYKKVKTGTIAEKERIEKQALSFAQRKLISLSGDTKLFDISNKRTYRPKFWRLVGRYWSYCLKFKKSAQYERSKLNLILQTFGRCYYNDIQREDIVTWMHDLKVTKKVDGERKIVRAEVATVNRRFAYIRRTYRFANTESNPNYRICHDPTIGIHKLKGENVRQMLITPEMFEKGYAAEGNTDVGKALWLAGWETGARPEELYGLKWTNIDLVSRRIILGAKATKTGDSRIIVMTRRLAVEIMGLKQISEYVFPSPSGGKLRDPRPYMKPIWKAIGRNVWFRDNRGAFTTRALMAGNDLPGIMAQQGHKSVCSSLRYAKDKEMRARTVIDKLDSIVAQNGTNRDALGAKVGNL